MDISVSLLPNGHWMAIDRDNYDVDCDHCGYFSRSPAGYGRTKEEAIEDLKQEMGE